MAIDPPLLAPNVKPLALLAAAESVTVADEDDPPPTLKANTGLDTAASLAGLGAMADPKLPGAAKVLLAPPAEAGAAGEGAARGVVVAAPKENAGLEAPKAGWPALPGASKGDELAAPEAAAGFVASVVVVAVAPKANPFGFPLSLPPPMVVLSTFGAPPKAPEDPNPNLGGSSFSLASPVTGVDDPKLKVGTPDFGAAIVGGFLAFSISSATAATALSFSFLFFSKNAVGHCFTEGVAAPAMEKPCLGSASVSPSASSSGRGRDAAWTAVSLAFTRASSTSPLPKEKVLSEGTSAPVADATACASFSSLGSGLDCPKVKVFSPSLAALSAGFTPKLKVGGAVLD
mmetsp:Transcript_31209/g.67218  ORF Transcript_31209/g.67218 Transcript_31209/m.67218 type:complete len:345 (+) Transcript_31209:1137-2171(+)